MQKICNNKPTIKITDSPPPIIPEGVCEGVLQHHEFFYYRGIKKLSLTFVIQAKGTEYDGTVIKRIYAWYDRDTTRAWTFIQDCERVLGRRFEYGEEASISLFEYKILKLKIKTVIHNWEKDDLPIFHRYSIVSSILGVAREITKEDVPF
jgi:hypothetical protein